MSWYLVTRPDSGLFHPSNSAATDLSADSNLLVQGKVLNRRSVPIGCGYWPQPNYLCCIEHLITN
jgi:hypothetical protein